MKKTVSVVIATYNRHKDCKQALNSLLNQTSEPLEIIVVDDTSQPPFTFTHPKVKIIRNETNRGVTISRNLGAKSAKGDIIAFIDDDAVADPFWIGNIQEAFNKNADVVGGRIFPLYLSNPPKWWSSDIYGIFVGVNTGTNFLMAGNLAVRKIIFEKIGYFRARSRKKKELFGGEENEFINRVSKYCRIEFDDSIKVHHKISKERMSMVVLLKRAWYQGVSNRLIFRLDIAGFAKLLGGIIWCLEKIFVHPKAERYYLLLIVKKIGYILPLSLSVRRRN